MNQEFYRKFKGHVVVDREFGFYRQLHDGKKYETPGGQCGFMLRCCCGITTCCRFIRTMKAASKHDRDAGVEGWGSHDDFRDMGVPGGTIVMNRAGEVQYAKRDKMADYGDNRLFDVLSRQTAAPPQRAQMYRPSGQWPNDRLDREYSLTTMPERAFQARPSRPAPNQASRQLMMPSRPQPRSEPFDVN